MKSNWLHHFHTGGLMKKGDIAIIVFLIMVALGGSVYLFLKGNQGGTKYVVITHDQKVVQRIKITDDYSSSYTFKEGDDYNIVKIEKGKVWIEEANCNNQVCVFENPIDKVGQAIVCLPHKLIVEIQGDEERNIDIISE